MSHPLDPEGKSLPNIRIRPLEEPDLPVADRVMRLAFGTFIGLPDPLSFMGDAGYVATRWRANPAASFAAEVDGELAGSNFATSWGSVGFFGPLTIHPRYWDRGVGRRLLEPVMDCFTRWGTRHAGLFTFPQSAKHVGLYHKFGFWPRFLTCVMSKPVEPGRSASGWARFSNVPENEREGVLSACRLLTGAIYEGLDIAHEIQSVSQQGLGDTVLLWDDRGLAALAVCHSGAGSEAGSGTCYIKFGAARPGPNAAQDFDRLLDACEAMASERGLTALVAGVNTGRPEAWAHLQKRGFRTLVQGVTMHRPNEPGYSRPGVYLIDDWR